MRKAVHELKYRNLRAIAPYLGRFLADHLQANPLPGEVLVPVPLHQRRLRERGYNQSSLLARELSKQTGLPVNERCLVRIKYSQPQTKAANVEERRQNVADAFRCCDDSVNGKQVIIVDDVCTSGATLKACAVALKSGGATSVWGLTLAREIQVEEEK